MPKSQPDSLECLHLLTKCAKDTSCDCPCSRCYQKRNRILKKEKNEASEKPLKFKNIDSVSVQQKIEEVFFQMISINFGKESPKEKFEISVGVKSN